MTSAITITLTGVFIASACALLGSFLMLRRMAMMADAISHAVLPGLVLGYFVARGPSLLAGFAGAALAAIVTVAVVEALQNTRKVGSESAIGIVFPAMFALGTLIISKYYANVHVDADAVLFGNIEFSGLDVLVLNGVQLGPQALWISAGLLIVNLLFVSIFFKELKLATFDPGLAAALGFSPIIIHYAFMTIISITTVGAFTAVGSVLVVAFLIVPAAAAYLLTNDLKQMMVLAVMVGALSAITGFAVAIAFDTTVAGAMATMAGVFFLLAFLFSPLHGIVAKAQRLQRQRMQVATDNLIIHLFNHADDEGEEHEAEVAHLSEELRWQPDFAREVIAVATGRDLIRRVNGHLELTDDGRHTARQIL